MALVGEMYIDELVAEDAILLCESYEDLETIEEAFKDTVKEKARKAKKQIMELAKEFKAWMMNLLNVIVNLFRTGEGLVNKYSGKIRDEWNKRGDKIKVKTYKYHHNQGALQELCESIKKTASGLSQSNILNSSFLDSTASLISSKYKLTSFDIRSLITCGTSFLKISISTITTITTTNHAFTFSFFSFFF